MRVLFCSTGSTGHLRPMRPLALALRRRGHRVAWATAPDVRAELQALDIEHFAVGLGVQRGRQIYRDRWPEVATLRGEALSRHTFPRLFGGVVAPAMVDGFAATVDGWRPDLVVNEPAALAAPLVCALRGLPHLTHAVGLRIPERNLVAAMAEFAPCWLAAGLPPPADAGLYRHLYLDIAPPALQGATAGAATIPTQALSPAATQVPHLPLPQSLLEALRRPARPTIYLSFGTVHDRIEPVRAAAHALARLGGTVVLTLSRAGAHERPADLPPNVHVEEFVDQVALMPHCDAVVSHAGAGTMLCAAVQGLPQLLLPQAADQFRNARALVEAGAGFGILQDGVGVEHIESVARTLLGSTACLDAAGCIAREIAAMPSADEVAATLEQAYSP